VRYSVTHIANRGITNAIVLSDIRQSVSVSVRLRILALRILGVQSSHPHPPEEKIPVTSLVIWYTGKVTGIPVPAGTGTGTAARVRVGYG